MHYHGGSVVNVMREKTHREQAFIREQDKKPGGTLDWLHLKRDEIRQVLGFFIGEPPVDPFSTPDTALATGPIMTLSQADNRAAPRDWHTASPAVRFRHEVCYRIILPP